VRADQYCCVELLPRQQPAAQRTVLLLSAFSSSRCAEQKHMPDTVSMWRVEWSRADVKNHSLIDDPTARVPGFDLPCRLWALLNRFRTDQGQSSTNLTTWGQSDDPLCCCGEVQTTMAHIVNFFPLTINQSINQSLFVSGKKPISSKPKRIVK